MIDVADSLAYLRTRFQTLITSPQVVSTIWQPRSLICCKVETAVPNFVDDVAAIMRLDLLLHGGHHLRRAQVYFLARRRAAGDEVGGHGVWKSITFAWHASSASDPTGSNLPLITESVYQERAGR